MQWIKHCTLILYSQYCARMSLNKPNLQGSKALTREPLRAAQLLRRQRCTHRGFDLRDIHRVDHAIGIHVFAEI
jgi:hypothetical protein